MTTAIKKRYMPSHIVLGDNFGLREPSMVMLEQIRTVNQSELTKYIGFVDSEYLQKRINVGLKKVLGFWVERPPKRKNDIRCLCGKCLNDYKSNPAYIMLCMREKGTTLGWGFLTQPQTPRPRTIKPIR